jgi:hypothetical protein
MAILLAASQSSPAQIGKGYQILLNRGLQLQGMSAWDDYWHQTTYSNANYSSVNWFSPDNPSLMGAPPGVPWSRWVNGTNDMPPEIMNGVDETPYMSQLISLEMGDEYDLNDGQTFTNEVNWFNSVRSNFPNTILYINSYGGQLSDSVLGNFIAQGQPDMICFDTYPFLDDWNSGAPNSGPYTSWFSELRRYRQWSISAGIPFGTYMQTFHAVQDYNQTIYRNPSPSELRLNISAALAFNAKVLIDFTYNTGATSLFSILPNGYSGDLYTNELSFEKQDANRRAENLGRALVCLQPIYDIHNQNEANPPPGPASGDACACLAQGTTTSIMIIQGKYLSGGATNITTPPPISFQEDPQTTSLNTANPANTFYTWWEFQKNDPYLAGWAITNMGTLNNGLPGEVIISWFKPLSQSFVGVNYTNEIYMMVVNAFTDNNTNGTAADCAQQITLNFLNSFTNIVMVDPETGLLSTNTLPIASTRRRLVLNLNGGDAALFKFDTGAPFVGHVPPGKARLAASMQSSQPALNLTQLTPGARYLVQSTPSLSSPAWTTLTGLVLTNSSYTFVDTSYTNNSSAFYRVVGVP